MRSKAYKDALLADIDSATKKMAASKDAAVLVLAQQGQYQGALDVPWLKVISIYANYIYSAYIYNFSYI